MSTKTFRAWVVHPPPDKATGEIVVLFQHVSLCNEAVRGDGGAWGSGPSLLSARTLGEKILPLERKQAVGLIGWHTYADAVKTLVY